MAQVIDAERERYKEMASEVRQTFEDALNRNKVAGEWRTADAPGSQVAGIFNELSRMADMIMIPKVSQEEYSGVESSFAEEVIMESGRPVIVVPRRESFDTIGNRVVVGWNGSREAARSAFDALPVLADDAEVDIVWVDPYKQASESGNVPGSELGASFARHGFKVNAEPMATSDMNTGEALLRRAGDLDADLLVIGAYGHSRMREFIFGGATQYVLQNLNMPVLMSH
jgi:nucleotide-binding universal stress UspA family protein